MSGHRVQFADLPSTSERKASPKISKPLKGNLKVTSSEDAEHLTRKRQVVSTNSPGNRCEAKSSRAGVLRRHTVGGARSSQEILAMQPSDMDKKREAFLEHLKQKYPHHASAIMGHQERLREQLFQGMLSALHSEINIQRYLLKIQNSSKQSLACPSPVFVDQLEHSSLVSLDALEVMSECDMPFAFTRGSRSRASLPVVRSTNQTKDRSLGVLYLQYGDDTKQIRMPNEITSVDTIRALFVSAFPHQLNMKMLESPSTAIYVKDETRNMYYELTDVRSITDHSCLKVYHKDPAHAFSHGARPSNGDARVHREMMYAGPSGHPLRQPPMGPPPPHMQGSMSPTTPHAMPPSPSRIPFGPRTSGSGVATMPRERAAHTLPASTPVRASSPCPSAILERRDVKPDEDVAAKSMSLPARAESHYVDPYMLHHQHAPPPDTVDYAYHRSTMRSYSNPGVPMEPTDHPSLFRQKSRKYTDSQLPMLGSKTAPPSPHRMGEVRMMDIHTVQPQSSMTLERASPIRQSFRKETPLSMDTMVKARSGMGSPATPDLQVHNPLAPSTDPQTRERMKAMEEQIASLTGLVQHALLKSHSTNSNKEHPRAQSDFLPLNTFGCHCRSCFFVFCLGGSPVLAPKVAAAPAERSPAPTPPLDPTPLHVNLHLFRRNVSELRLQLQHMRQLQLQNQECVRAQIKHAEQEISVKLAEMLRRQDDPTQKQRTLVEEERHRYLSMQERVLTQLEDLEQYVETLRTDSSPAASQRAVTLKEVEEGAVSLRKVGENLAGLKGEFPALQSRMRAVLRVEVEAVKFLKEEPHKLDSMLKRVRTLTDTLSNLRRSTTDSLLKPSDPVSSTSSASEKTESAIVESLEAASVAPQSSTVRSEVMTSNPVVIHHAQASPVTSQQSQQSTAPSPIPPAAQRRESTPSPTKQLKKPSLEQTQIPNNSHNGVSANGIPGKGPSPNFVEEIHASRSKNKNRAVSIEAAEKEWEEKRQNMGHYDGQEFERMLQEAEANMLRGIPNLEVPSEPEGSPAVDLASLEEVVEKNEPTAAPAKQANKSPPPPPPRRNYTTNTGMTTTRSGEVIYTSRKDSDMVQVYTVPILSKAIPVVTDLANQKLIFGTPKVKERKFEEIEENNETSLSPDLSGEGPPPPPPDNFAFMITNTKVQALSTGEYHQLVNAKKGSVQTVTVGSKRPCASGNGIASGGDASTNGSTGADNASKKPVIIIFDEPMDIRSAYKRLSTIFECEEELERMLAEERIDEESEETEEEEWTRGVQVKQNGDDRNSGKGTGSNSPADITDGRVINSSSSSSLSEGGALVDVTGDAKQDGKKKFKLKFPKKQLAALTQAIRAGSKTGKKTLQVVVYEDEEESDGTVRQHKETKRFEIACSKTESSKSNLQEPTGRSEEIRKNTYKTLNSLEQTIKQLENTISEMGPKSSEEPEILVKPETQDNTTEESPGHSEKVLAPKTLVPRSSSASKGPGLRKKTKPQLRMPVPVSAKVRQHPGPSEKERATKPQKLQDSQRQFRQANGSAKRSGGDPKSTSPTVPASKIPAFSSSMGKGLSQSDSTNIVNSSSPLSSSIPTSKSSVPPHRSSSTPSSHIPSLSNGSLKFAPPTHSTKGLSIPTQTQNGRPFSSSTSSCSHSPLSPTMLSQSAKSVHTIHTPSFTSYSRPHNGSASKSAIPTVTVTKDAA
uniref:Si:ch211-285f17.1 n=1 Tax=Cyprinus carpio carpio TaxID=630221 RepID=A0A9J8B485_CYPCA